MTRKKESEPKCFVKKRLRAQSIPALTDVFPIIEKKITGK